LDASGLIGKNVKDENNREIGKVISFLIDSSGQAKEVLIENRYGKLITCPVERMNISKDGISLTSYIDKRAELISEKFPVTRKKRKILEKLLENKVIPQEIYENLCKEFDKILDEMKNEAQTLQKDIEKKIKKQEDYIRTLQLARAFLEIERGIGTLKDEVYQQSLLSLLKESKNASQRKISLLKIKNKISSILQGEETIKEEPQKESTAEHETKPQTMPDSPSSEAKSNSTAEPAGKKQAVTVHMTQD